jgi:hypothetical protein
MSMTAEELNKLEVHKISRDEKKETEGKVNSRKGKERESLPWEERERRHFRP